MSWYCENRITHEFTSCTVLDGRCVKGPDDYPDVDEKLLKWSAPQQWSMPSRRCTFRWIENGPLCALTLQGSECAEHGERGIEVTTLELRLSYSAPGERRWVHLTPHAPSQVGILEAIRLNAEDYRKRYRMSVQEEAT